MGPKHGKWLGFDQLEYEETAVRNEAGGSIIVTRVKQTGQRLKWARGAGTIRFKSTVTIDGVTHAADGAESVGHGGITADVMRVSFRRKDGFAGHLTSDFNVPNVFGSAGHGPTHQTDRFQGTDCADVIIGAARRAGAKINYTHAAGLVRHANAVTGLLKVDSNGVQHIDGPITGRQARLKPGVDIKEGDLVLIDYSNFSGSRRKWDHVAVFLRDAKKAGTPSVLDPADRIMHIGFKTGLRDEPLSGQGPVTIQVLRFKRSVARQFRR
ncbi:MAG: hypothetical protein ACI9OJ_005022 [Myxococcota bacterium]